MIQATIDPNHEFNGNNNKLTRVGTACALRGAYWCTDTEWLSPLDGLGGRSSQCVFARNWSKLPECAELGWHWGTPEWKSNLFDMAYFIENMPAHKFTWNTGSERIYVRNGVLIEEVHRSCSAQLIFLLCRRFTNTVRETTVQLRTDSQSVAVVDGSTRSFSSW